jgi:peroxisomal 2,4-dienoyl-CoA reductase
VVNEKSSDSPFPFKMSVVDVAPKKFPESPFRDNIIAGRRAVISGGGSGIGFEIARQLGLHGAAVCIMGRRENVLQTAVDRLRADGVRHAIFCQGDVRDFDSCAAVAARAVGVFGGVDILVNCAAGNFLSPAEALNAKGFRVVMEIDAFGVFNMSQVRD